MIDVPQRFVEGTVLYKRTPPYNIPKQRVARKRRMWKTSVLVIVGNLVLGLYFLRDCFPVRRARSQEPGLSTSSETLGRLTKKSLPRGQSLPERICSLDSLDVQKTRNQ